MSGFKNTISYIKPVVMKYKPMFYGIFVLHAFRITLNVIIAPIFYKKIIDVISLGGDRALVAGALFQNIFFIVMLLPLAWIFGRATQFYVSKFQSAVIRDLHDFSFQKLHGHSYTFFADHFSGALVNKSRKFVRAFEQMHDLLIDRFWNCFVLFVAAFIVFFFQAPSIALTFFLMSAIYIFIVVLMSRKKMEYDLAEAAADSRVTAYLADSITNALAIKSSSALDKEINDFKKVTGKDATLRLKAWLFGNKMNAIQSAISMFAQVLVTFLTGYLWVSGKISAGLFLLVQTYSIAIGQSFWDLGQASTKFTKAYLI